jgi:hypothetical protein
LRRRQGRERCRPEIVDQERSWRGREQICRRDFVDSRPAPCLMAARPTSRCLSNLSLCCSLLTGSAEFSTGISRPVNQCEAMRINITPPRVILIAWHFASGGSNSETEPQVAQARSLAHCPKPRKGDLLLPSDHIMAGITKTTLVCSQSTTSDRRPA